LQRNSGLPEFGCKRGREQTELAASLIRLGATVL
jgi:hypothetical protein